VTDPPAGAGRAAPGRRELLGAVLGCLAAAAVVLLAVGRPWVRAASAGGSLVTAVTIELPGRTLRPGVAALGLVALAAAVAVPATRGVARALVGAVVVVAGLGIVVLSADVLRDSAGAAAATDEVRRTAGVATTGATAWPTVAAVAGGCVAVCGIGVLVRGRRWPGMSARYDAPQTRRARTADPDTALWEALDRGDDPT
jgi:uncharacterized membrane protein (TIGR02234 family)